MNWGYKILTVIVVFIIAMLTMVYISFRQTNEMVDANYYEKEIKYQSLINASNELNKVNENNLIVQRADTLDLKIPEKLTDKFSNGSLVFQRNSDEKKDQSFNFSPDINGMFSVNVKSFAAGNYVAKITWNNDGVLYYKEQTIFIQK